MLVDLIVRFVAGGIIVCVFAVIGDLLQPKSLAGIFGAAPSVALATLGLTFAKHGGFYSGTEGRSMLLGSVAFFFYALLVGRLLMRHRTGALVAASASWILWIAVSFGLWSMFLR